MEYTRLFLMLLTESAVDIGGDICYDNISKKYKTKEVSMMLGFKKTLSVFVAGLIAASGITAVSAHDIGGGELPLISREGVSTEVVFTNGTEKTYDGLIDVSGLEGWSGVESVDSYTVLGNGAELLSVTLNGIAANNGSVGASSQKMNGYYALEFTFPDTGREAFLTGLTPANLEETQNALIDSFVYGKELQLENFSYIDAEKTTFSHVDDDFCWAAAASNTLQYAGWLEPTGFGDSDDLLDQIAVDFTEGPLDTISGYGWFLNGFCKTFKGTARIKNKGSGAYMRDYPGECLTEEVVFSSEPVKELRLLQQRLREGFGVGVDVRFPSGAVHAVSCWGYINDPSFDETDPKHYSALIISDSDSDMRPQEDRRVAPNKLNVLSMEHKEGNFRCPTYDNASPVKFYTILPFDKAQAYLDPDPCATKDKVNNVDLKPTYFAVGGGDFPQFESDETIYAGTKPAVTVSVSNLSLHAYNGALEYRITVKNAAGETVLSEVHSSAISVTEAQGADIPYELLRSGLPAGSYTAELELNCGKRLDEAFYYNNKAVASFEVAEMDTDLSRLGVTASVSGIAGDETVLASVECQGFEEVTLLSTEYKSGNTVYGTVSWSDEWLEYSGAELSAQKRIKSAETYIFRTGYRIKDREGTFYVYSDVVSPPKFGAELIPSQEYSVIDMPDDELSLGKKNGFTAKNTSAEVYGNLTGQAYLTLKLTNVDEEGKAIPIGTPVAIDLAPGEVSPEISIDALPDTVPKEGVYGLFAVIEGTAGGNRISKEEQLAMLRFREKPSTVVTTSGDSADPFDNVISLREAIAEYDGSTAITFSEDIKDNKGYTLSSDNVMIIDKNVVINAPQEEGSFCSIIPRDCGKPVFEVKKQGSLTISGFRFIRSATVEQRDYVAAKNGAGILCEGGSVTLDRCSFSSFIAKTYGGAVYCNGGSLKVSNSKFSGNSAAFGGAAALNNNAKGEFINCAFDGNFSDKGAVFNNNSALNMVGCSLYKNHKTEVYGTDGACGVTSYGNTSLLNCALADNLPEDDENIAYVPYDLAGTMKVLGCAFTSADGRVESDERCISGVSRDGVLFYQITSPSDENPDYVFEPVSVERSGEVAFESFYLPNPKILSKGMSVTVRDGYLVYSNGKETFETGIAAVFDDTLYENDAVGNRRGAVFGCISDFTQTEDAKGYNMGDVNGDGRVNISDATHLQRYLAEMVKLDGAQLAAAELYHEKNNLGTDISKDITISNVTEIQKYIAEWIGAFEK